MNSSITAIAPHPSHEDTAAIVCGDGSVTLMQIRYDAAYDFHGERYAYKCVHDALFGLEKLLGHALTCMTLKLKGVIVGSLCCRPKLKRFIT